MLNTSDLVPIFKLSILLGLILSIANLSAASMMDGFTDPQDGMFDVSHWLAEKKGSSLYLLLLLSLQLDMVPALL